MKMENSGKKKTPIDAGDIGTLNPNPAGVTSRPPLHRHQTIMKLLCAK